MEHLAAVGGQEKALGGWTPPQGLKIAMAANYTQPRKAGL